MSDDQGNQGTPKPPAAPSTADLFAKAATPEGRAEVFKILGIKNPDESPPEILDEYVGDDEGREAGKVFASHFGEEGAAQAGQDLDEYASLLNVGGKLGEELAGLTAKEIAVESAVIVNEWRETLKSPEKAQAMLTAMIERADVPGSPYNVYIRGNATPEMKGAITKLWQAAHGEPTTGRPRRKGDGLSY